ncbi:hypothetical protein BJY01DRAFT_236627 [Aspergillus pseudoustus]|uniref:Uncharacterized protein n=1 Tax=Aspergillus pseudoustus TaxID=1810923 RepID=A0ABR4JL92_9EURO
MTQPAPRRALVDLDNIEFYRPQPSKSLPPESALSIPLTLPPLSILPVAATRKALPRGDGALLFDRPYGWDSSCDPEVLNSFDVELARCANAASLATRSHTDSELTQGETGNETVGASTFALTSSPSLSSREETTDPPGPFESTASREIIEIPTEPDGHVCPPSPDVQERDQPPDIQPCGLHDEPSVSNGRCSSIPHHDNHGMTECRTPSSHVPNNDIANKPLGERETDQVLLGDGLPQPKQIISIPALSEEDPLLNDQRLPLIGVADSGPEDQLHSDSGNSFLAESKKTSVHERCPMPHRLVAGVTTSPETPSTITKPPRRKSFEVAQARIVERRNRPRRNCQPGFNVVLRDCHPGCSDREESSRPTKRRKRAPRPVGKVTNCISSGPLGKSLHSSASAQSAKACHSQDIFGHAVLTVETHALGTSFFFSFEPNSPNQLDAPQFRFSLDEPRRLTAPSSMPRMGGGAYFGVTGPERKAAISGSVERMRFRSDLVSSTRVQGCSV